MPLAGEVDLGPWLAAIDGICAYVVCRVWHARWPSPRSRATTPADRQTEPIHHLQVELLKHPALAHSFSRRHALTLNERNDAEQ